MSYKIVWSKKAYKQLKELPYLISKRIYAKINKLLTNPSELDIKHLIGVPYYRLRVGDYRVIFEIKRKELKIFILKVGHRKEIYKK